MIDITLVSYINTRPFMDGLEARLLNREIQFHLMPPAQCATHLLEHKCQMALIPVGSLPDFRNIALMPNYCLGANGAVESVFLFSHKPIEALDTVMLDRHSRSSNGLVRILFQHHWKKTVQFRMPEGKHFDQINGSTGGVVIGDKAIRIRAQYPYAYDLSLEWKKLTGLPFTFAVWAYYPGAFSAQQLLEINDALAYGVKQASRTAQKWAKEYNMSPDFAKYYLESCMDYYFDAPKHRALELYIKNLAALPELAQTTISCL